MIGFSLIVFHILLALLSPLIVEALPADPFTREAGRNAEPSLQYPFGGDEQGRDVFYPHLIGWSDPAARYHFWYGNGDDVGKFGWDLNGLLGGANR